MSIYTSTFGTQLGPFTMVVDEQGRVLASGWTPHALALVSLIHPSLRGPTTSRRDLGEATRAARAYHDGDLDAPGHIEVRQEHGGQFLGAAWQRLRTVKPGELVSYAQLAAETGNPAAARAAAAACARNAAALFVPCHRVVRTGGALGGFRWGIEVKRSLIQHEAS